MLCIRPVTSYVSNEQKMKKAQTLRGVKEKKAMKFTNFYLPRRKYIKRFLLWQQQDVKSLEKASKLFCALI